MSKEFRVLLIYANTPMEPLMPLGVAYIATALQQNGVTVKLFDTTFYKSDGNSDSQKARTDSLQICPVDYSSVGIKVINRDYVEDFVRLVKDFRPQLIGLSCVELTYLKGLKLLESVKKFKIPNIIGGCFATFSPDKIISNDIIDMVCVGEGEETLVKLVENMSRSEPILNVPNLWIKNGKQVIRPQKMHLADLDLLPIPRFDVFAPERIYRPMSGKIYRMIPIEFSRGCPYNCSYCSAPSYTNLFRVYGRWLRFKSLKRIMKEIDFYVNNYDVEYFYFISETFLAIPKEQRQEFYKYYKRYKIPFWFNTRPETIREEDINILQDIGCHRISIGIESGNEEFRRKVLRRNYSNDAVLRAADILSKSKIEFSVNNMIGFPDETREMIFDTIELNRKVNTDSYTVSVFQPFRGTELYDYCVAKGYLSPEKMCVEAFSTPILQMPNLTKEEISGLYRTFNLYVRLDKDLWPIIKKAEKLDEEGDKIFFELVKKLKQSKE